MESEQNASVDRLLDHWRDRIGATVFAALAVVSTVLTVSFATSIPLSTAAMGLGITVVMAALAAHRRASRHLRGGVLAAIIVYSIVNALLGGGDPGAAAVYLFTGVVLISLLLDTRAALGLLACGTVIAAVNWWAITTNTAFPPTSLAGPVERAAGFALSQLALGLVVVISMGFMLTRLREALAHQVVTATRLALEADDRQRMVEELQEANNALEENQARLVRAGKVEVLGQLAGTVAHDLNNVLTVVLAEADLARDHAEEHADAIVEAVDEAVRLTRQLLVVGRQDLARPEPVDLAVILEGARKLLQRITPGNVTLSLEAEPIVVRADPVQVRQVLLNLCANAVQAMPDGGTLEVRVTEAGTHAQLSVRDTGIGMDEATRAHIFEPFFTTRTKDAGSGLGLASVQSIAEELGGTVECSSAPGQGTTFLVTLPRCDEPPSTSRLGEATEVAGHLEGCVIVVAEDEHRVRHALASALRKAGARVVEAADGRSAVALAELESRLDLVWTDVVMPRGGGRAVVDWVHAHRPDTPVVVSSGWADEPSLRAELAAGRHPFVPKPFTPAQALACVVDAMHKASAPTPSAAKSTQEPGAPAGS